jgi:hypothetical protein
MAYRRKTLRKFTTVARKVAELQAEAEGISRKLKKLVDVVQELERDANAIAAMNDVDFKVNGMTPEEWKQSGLTVKKSGRVKASS